MFFFIAGVQPRTVTLDDQPRMCPSCGLFQARLKRVDHYISVFFIPLIRIKKGTPVLVCERCGAVSSEQGEPGPPREPTFTCPHCGQALEPGFRYCPYCGRPL